MTDEIIFHHGTTMVRRLRFAPGEAMPWQRVAVSTDGQVNRTPRHENGIRHAPAMYTFQETSK